MPTCMCTLLRKYYVTFIVDFSYGSFSKKHRKIKGVNYPKGQREKQVDEL